MKTRLEWVSDKSGIGSGVSLRLNGIIIAEVLQLPFPGGGTTVRSISGLVRLTAYHRTVEKAMAAVEKRFSLARVKVTGG